MKNMRKIASLVLALVMVFAMATTAFAEEATSTLTIVTTSGHTYKVYQLLKGDVSNLNDGAGILSNVTAGSNLKSGTTVEAFDAAIKGTDGNYLQGVALAEAAYAYVDTTNAAYTVIGTGAKVDTTVANGYYLVVDTWTADEVEWDALSSYMVAVVGDTTMTPKVAKPEVDKSVSDDEDDAEATDPVDYAIGETIEFTLTATLAADTDYDAYDTYKVVFTDTMSSGISFSNIVSVTVDGVTVTDYNCTATENQAGGTWTLTITDLKSYDGVNLTDGANVVVKYNGKLNSNAVIAGEGNKNTVKLEYSNDPNSDGTGETPEENVYVFTWEIPVYKYTGTGEDKKPLEGAGFTLYTDSACTTPVKVTQGTAVTVDDVLVDVYKVDPNSNTTQITTSATGKFQIEGLDEGTYYLKETATPTGYNTCEVVTVKIDSQGNVQIANSEGNFETVTEVGVLNNSGSTLPSTGGMGTTLFYLVGGILVVAAVVLLVTKKRMATAE